MLFYLPSGATSVIPAANEVDGRPLGVNWDLATIPLRFSHHAVLGIEKPELTTFQDSLDSLLSGMP